MDYQYTLPLRQNSLQAVMANEKHRNRTIAGPEVAPPGFKRPRIISYHARTDRVAPIVEAEKENLQTADDEPPSFQSIYNDENNGRPFDPADSSTWGFTPLPLLDGKQPETCQRGASGLHNLDDDAALLASPILPPSPEPIPESDGFLKMIQDNLRLTHSDEENQRQEMIEGDGEDGHDYTTSSIYNSNECEVSGLQSPALENGNRLSLTNREKYSRQNDRLSNLRSSSGESTKPASNATELGGDVLADAIAAENEWSHHLSSTKGPASEDGLSERPDVVPEDALSYSRTPPNVVRHLPSLGHQRSIT